MFKVDELFADPCSTYFYTTLRPRVGFTFSLYSILFFVQQITGSFRQFNFSAETLIYLAKTALEHKVNTKPVAF